MSQTIATRSTATAQSGLMGIVLTAFLGMGIVFLAGHAQSATLHDAAHDIRHGTGFPCH
ncbi:MAG: CbtB domain-containing protein [Pseudomonadota bacterium]|jgi:cobalt transporter subunit CbtB|uniref:Cobalt transporter subunit CbtB n=1 Tax=Thalassococcus halodurans TaxID=373675 RepID=A0A1H6A0U2_9RHOB|nr:MULTISPECIES: CbtB domain-containing protein [Thalassococcus]MEC7667600.1 CbtB domain-containing protein [Pseudomonadota bacterium]MBO6868090.1 CbtB-domain containing protein [Thalassococcus sp.]MEC8580056.1 CbtB domain-containing protein [Pseudomonadota bacterium]MEE3361469.1 CbtB domain-containing protein [Pseudomonadota bacterium]SEG42373.1 cobalt transporter subunit CbtB [Thalassococcus halodurans]